VFKRMISAIFMLALGFVPARAQEKPAVVVHAFTVAPDVKFPYDMNQLQTRAIAMLKDKDGAQFDALPAVPTGQAGVYTLDGEVLEWHKGNTAERMLIAMGSVVGRENAKVHYWLTDKDGKKIFENTDTIRQGFMKNGHEKNTGTLATPFAEKITERLKEANLAPAGGTK
jgi:hypothetical protein